MMKWITGLVGWAPQHEKVVADDLKQLDSLKASLGDQATAYVCRGESETVLSTLATLSKGNELEVCKTYHRANSPAVERHRMFARAHPYPCDQVQRYVDVLTIVGEPALDDAPGSRAVPKKIRIFFAEVFQGLPDTLNSWPRKVSPLDGKGATADTALEMVRRLGGRIVDFVDVVYSKGQGYSAIGGELYRRAVDMRSFVAAHPEAVVEAGIRMPATSRAEMIRELIGWQLNQDDRFVDFLVAQAGDGAKAAREAAMAALTGVKAEVLEPRAIKVLGEGDVERRAGMVDLLGRLRTPTGLAALRAHRETEKAARVAAAIDTVLSIADSKSIPAAVDDSSNGYVAIDGSRIDVPSLQPLKSGSEHRFGDADRTTLRAAIAEANEKAKKQNEENARKGYNWKAPQISESMADKVVSLLNGDASKAQRDGDRQIQQFLNWGPGVGWARSALAKLPDDRGIAWAATLCGSAQQAMTPYAAGPAADRIHGFLSSPEGDVRHLELIDIAASTEFEHGNWTNRQSRKLSKGDFLRNAVQDGWAYAQAQFAEQPRNAVWPYLAENLEVFDEAMGLKPEGPIRLDRAAAIRLLGLLPVAPARYFAPLLEAATGTTRAGRAEARAMLGSRPEVEERLVALLDDTRQAVRAGAAEWLAERKDAGAAKALWARLKKEKSELARAAMLTALKKLGEDLSKVLGSEALVAEAHKGLKSAKFEKLDWLGLDNVPNARFRGGKSVPKDVLRWWILLAYKLKQPGGNALFSIYLDQLEADDAKAFSTWILDSWVNYDTASPSEIEANAHAKANAASRYQAFKRYYPDYTEDKALADLRREFMGQYLHSGADSKGILALCVKAPSALAADRTRAYLKNHGSRTSQASALLEMLTAIGDPVALQVVIAAATRLKQKGVQKFAGELVAKVAEARDWTMDELADRTIPSAGFDEDGVLSLPCGEDGKEYEARLTNELTVLLRNPAGKEVASLPAGTDEATAASKKQLSTTKKELKQIASMQTARLYEALCAERSWTSFDWLRNFHEHPVMRRLIERIIWLGLDGSGALVGAFRPTAEGDFTNEADQPVDVSKFGSVRIAHGALLDDAMAQAWEKHLKDYEVKPLFVQFGRTLLKVAYDDKSKTEIVDRKGWLTDAFTVRGVASKLGYERGPALDGGFFNEYRKTFQSAGLAAVIEFTGNSLPEENVPAALISLKFERALGPGRFGGATKLGDVPPVLLSECWNDYRAMAAKGAFDPEWEKKSPW